MRAFDNFHYCVNPNCGETYSATEWAKWHPDAGGYYICRGCGLGYKYDGELGYIIPAGDGWRKTPLGTTEICVKCRVGRVGHGDPYPCPGPRFYIPKETVLESKSILDGVPRVCSSCGKNKNDHGKVFPCGQFPPTRGGSGLLPTPPEDQTESVLPELQVVSSCPKCGSPIYGYKYVKASVSDDPTVRHTCDCRLPVNTVGTVRTT